MKPRFFIIMGVSGCGKTSVGQRLAESLGWDFYDSDDFHSPANIAKMAKGVPLSDEDRAPWLDSLRALIAACLQSNRPGVLACSALKERYRQTLLSGNPGAGLVYLKGSYDLIWSRTVSRPGHYMKPEMLRSQFDALEEPQNTLTIDISLSVVQIVNLLHEELT